jgi:hypothetical protein
MATTVVRAGVVWRNASVIFDVRLNGTAGERNEANRGCRNETKRCPHRVAPWEIREWLHGG